MTQSYDQNVAGTLSEEEKELNYWDNARQAYPRLVPPHAFDEIDHHNWLIEGVQTKDSLVLTYGASGAGKSFYAIDQAMHVATLKQYCGRHVADVGGYVVYVSAEGRVGMQDRILAWMEFNQIEMPIQELGLLLWRGPVDLLSENGLDELRDAISTLGLYPPLIVFDTLAANCGPNFDENSAQHIAAIMTNLKSLQSHCEHDCSIELIHHTGKGDSKNPRGSSALLAAVDTAIFVQKTRSGMKVSCTKQRDAECFSSQQYDLRKVEFIDRRNSEMFGETFKRSSLVPIANKPEEPGEPPQTKLRLTIQRRSGLQALRGLHEQYDDAPFASSEFTQYMDKHHGIRRQTTAGVRKWLIEHKVLSQPSRDLLQIQPRLFELLESI